MPLGVSESAPAPFPRFRVLNPALESALQGLGESLVFRPLINSGIVCIHWKVWMLKRRRLVISRYTSGIPDRRTFKSRCWRGGSIIWRNTCRRTRRTTARAAGCSWWWPSAAVCWTIYIRRMRPDIRPSPRSWNCANNFETRARFDCGARFTFIGPQRRGGWVNFKNNTRMVTGRLWEISISSESIRSSLKFLWGRWFTE